MAFRAPVGIGALLRLSASVVLVQPDAPQQPLVTVDVEALVAKPEERTSASSNTFTFTFAVDPADLPRHAAALLRRTLPATAEEAQRQLEVRELVAERAMPYVAGRGA